MAGMEFEYDERGGTFYYFLLSFYALVLIPCTYYLWPYEEAKEDPEKTKKQCRCEGCLLKNQRLKEGKPWQKFKKRALKVAFIIGWIGFALLLYRVSQVELDFTEFDPYAELGIDRGATTREVKKAYRQLSVKYHPDKEGGDQKKFMRIAKAHAALTDDEARKNWEEYGNPDGPGATHFGIALPKWIVEKQNSVWVLAAYGLVFMIILPLVVGTWWYRSIKFSGDAVLLDTTQLYYCFLHKTPNMILKRAVMILAGSLEFSRSHNQEVQERPSDNEEIPLLMKDLPNLNEKNKERPLCFPYSVKARALLYAHFSRIELPPKTLELDRQYMLKKCPYLINEMVNILAQLVALAHAGRVAHEPRLDTVENCMRMSKMVIQALWDTKSPLLQLPHISEDMLRHFVTKRRNIRGIKDFVCMKEEDRRSLLRSISDEEYKDIMNVCTSMPHITMKVHTSVLDDEDSSITAGSIVTVNVSLTREPLQVLLGDDVDKDSGVALLNEEENGEGDNEGEEEENENEETTKMEVQTIKPKIWEKQKKKKGGKKAGKKKPIPFKQQVIQRKVTASPTSDAGKTEESQSNESTPNGRVKKPKKAKDSDAEDSCSDISDVTDSDVDDRDPKSNEDDDDTWEKFQEEAKKENVLEAKSKETHSVHCPYFPLDKQEWWWVYVADRKHHQLITAPVQVTSLKHEEEISLKFSAPTKPGNYQYTVVLRSDSLFDFDQSENIKMDVKEAKKVESHPQWEISDDEEKDEDDNSESELSSDYDESDDDE
ncbi:unnamed protein product [Owenia fusiformis]|uniref:Uncharacterized protein n=1 Tax=Owenia fusiformis TaxID=6347 RepID=A0A8J1TB00_OWEFU|nr:unnamed protein product [Owenia fusiformis]